MVRTNQGGSVLSFIVVAAVLVALFIGGVYTVHQLVTKSDNPVVVQPEKSPPKSDKTKEDTPKSQQQKNKDGPSQSSQNASNNNTAQKPSSELPRTGPAELLGSLVALGLLTGSAVSYVRSRRLVPSL